MNIHHKNIILIDDDPIFHSIFSKNLKQVWSAHSLEYFNDAEKALLHFDKVGIVKPDIIFLDIHMSNMNGWEFLDDIQKRNIPFPLHILIITSSVDARDYQMSQNYPFLKGYIQKPLSNDFLKNIIKKSHNF